MGDLFPEPCVYQTFAGLFRRNQAVMRDKLFFQQLALAVCRAPLSRGEGATYQRHGKALNAANKKGMTIIPTTRRRGATSVRMIAMVTTKNTAGTRTGGKASHRVRSKA